jgi:thiamine transport system ATP-binding protein
MLFQENNLFTHLTVRQNIALGMHPGLKLNAPSGRSWRPLPCRWG